MPACLEPIEQPLLDLGRDVGVGLDDPVVEMVSQTAGLGDLRYAVGDQPTPRAPPDRVGCNEPGVHCVGQQTREQLHLGGGRRGRLDIG